MMLAPLLLVLAVAGGPARAGLDGMPGPRRPPAPGLLIVAQKQQVAPRPDPAMRELAARRAGTLVLSSADGERQCPLLLKADAGAQGFQLQFDRPACEGAIPFLSQVTGWIADPSGTLRLLNAQGRTAAEFTEATGGSYEALREGDGVYFLSDPAVADGAEVTAASVSGAWILTAGGAKPLCRWTLEKPRAPREPGPVSVAQGCDPAMARLAPTSWRLEGGNILVATRGGATIRFARQEDGGWARVPERGKPLLMSRP